MATHLRRPAVFEPALLATLETPVTAGPPLPDFLAEFAGRHPETLAIMKHFRWDHLPEHLQAVSRPCGEHAFAMARALPDGTELTAGLRKALEAKDCFVRAALG